MDVLGSARFIPKVSGRPHLVHPLDGRWGGLHPRDLTGFVGELASAIDTASVDFVLGFPEGGLVPAFAFAQAIDRPLILSTRLRLQGEPVITFEEPHSPQGTSHYLHGVRAGSTVIIIEDEITTGRTTVNAVRALRAAGVRVDHVGVLLAVDTEALWQRMADEGIAMHVQVRVPPGHGGPSAGT